MLKTVLPILLFTLCINIAAQSITDEFSDNSDSLTSNLTQERVESISGSRRILVLTNDSSSFDRGDFVSLVFANELAVRGLIAKLDGQKAAFKITKIYSVPHWKSIKQGLNVKIIRGDDSFFNEKRKTDESEVDALGSTIQSEDDLYNDTSLLEGEIDLGDKSKRVIQTDNIVGFNFGKITTDSDSYSHPNLSWMYQFKDNIWLEVAAGYNNIENYPASGLATTLTSYTIKFQYAFATPFFTVTMPYLGYRITKADSPNAGVYDSSSPNADLDAEKAQVAILDGGKIAAGVTVLRRLVPGWFARLDLGVKMLNLGIALEF